jgi:hypothetical protein
MGCCGIEIIEAMADSFFGRYRPVFGLYLNLEGLIWGNFSRKGVSGAWHGTEARVLKKFNHGWTTTFAKATVVRPAFAKASADAEAMADESVGKPIDTDLLYEGQVGADWRPRGFSSPSSAVATLWRDRPQLSSPGEGIPAVDLWLMDVSSAKSVNAD